MIQPYQTLLLLVTAGLTHVNGSNNNNTVTSRQRFLAHNNTPDEQKLKLSEHPSNISHSNFSNTFFIVITIGFIISLGLIFLWVVRRTSRKNASLSDCNRTERPEHLHFNMKCPTIAVSESSHSCQFDKTDSIESLVPVLDDNTSKYKIPETLQQEMKLSWTEVSAGTTSSYNGAALSTHQSRSAAPMLTNAPAQRREVNENQAPASDRSSHTDEYSIDMLESPASTEYSFSSESDDFFPSTCWDVDSYRSASSTFLSTTSSNVFGSNHARNSGVWKQVYGPDNTPPLGLGQSPLSSGALFVRDIDPDAIRRTHLDTRVYGARSTNRMRLDIEL